uniref:Reverse transcriptase domain-containing protein n=1 Tax=Helicotheca tamesis TaxID=374047 RepID=A0A7S2MNV9_9STRA|mmetsp:Transcript_1917/g.2742  ORF Transcript_1917/g.2742 Transcript_1917/m.2742 type:complete len:165 (+) Transcript_1917:895-1389(+)
MQHAAPSECASPLSEAPSLAEVRAAIKRMANGKSPGPSDISSDAYKAMTWMEPNPDDEDSNADAEYNLGILHSILVEFWEGRLDIKGWKTGSLRPIPKKGDLSNPNKWCPICLLEITYKVLASIIARRINPIVRDDGLESQCGCLNSKGCQDALFALKSALQIR